MSIISSHSGKESYSPKQVTEVSLSSIMALTKFHIGSSCSCVCVCVCVCVWCKLSTRFTIQLHPHSFKLKILKLFLFYNDNHC
jgi:hypothetical protein